MVRFWSDRRSDEMKKFDMASEKIDGHAVVTKYGCFVCDGLIQESSDVRLVRDGKEIWSGKIGKIKAVHFGTELTEARSGQNRNITLDGFDDLVNGDIIESFTRMKL